ncbi:MAG TPA: M20/M25/M40 family metallo-hydrolase [Pyrinomonadaceae bacterium]|nr:M20/M25/M40 family metallo-hydrolase [Pyrinomonadaceae bacterium]
MKALNRLFAYLVVAALAIGAFAQQPATTNQPSVERLRAHIEYLASDKLEGRRTGSPGATLAAEYIAREFSRYGLRRSIGHDTAGMSILEADSPNRYLQKFPYVAGVELGKKNALTINVVSGNSPETQGSFKTRSSETPRVGEDWMPLGFSSNGEIQNANYVSVGYGITAAELKYDSFAGHSLKDTVAIALSGTPDGDNPHGQFARYEDPRWKAIAARNAGAKALFIIAREENFNDERLSRLSYDNAGEAGIPVVVISMQTAAKLFSSGSPREAVSMLTEAAKENKSIVPTPGGALSISTDIVRREVEATNVIGILDGSDPTLKNEVIVIGAHYDHLGRGGEGSLAQREGEIHHGADDNASGVAGVLELARLFTSQKLRPRRTIVFMAFSGEEEGLLGSNYYVNHPILPLANTVTMLNMDMIGRAKDNKLVIGGVGTSTEWREMIAAANAPERIRVAVAPASPQALPRPVNTSAGRGIPIVTGANGTPVVTLAFEKPFDLTLNEDGFGPSDHSSFYAKQVPVLFFWTGTHDDYHKPSDTADKINYADEARIVNLVERVIYDIDTSDKRPVYAVAKSESTGRSMGFRVYLGTIPNYADTNDGLLLDGVRDDSPAAKAGLKAGDKVVKLAGREVRNVQDYTYVLGEMKAGQEYEVEVMRGGERIKLVITPAARK